MLQGFKKVLQECVNKYEILGCMSWKKSVS